MNTIGDALSKIFNYYVSGVPQEPNGVDETFININSVTEIETPLGQFNIFEIDETEVSSVENLATITGQVVQCTGVTEHNSRTPSLQPYYPVPSLLARLMVREMKGLNISHA